MSRTPRPDDARRAVEDAAAPSLQDGDTDQLVSPLVSPDHQARKLGKHARSDTGDSGDSTQRSPSSPRRVTWTAPELLAESFPDPTWAVPGIITDGLTLLCGAPKAGKSWLAYGTAIAIASGGKTLGRDVKQGDVLYLALEDTGRRLQERLAKILAGASAPAALTVTIDAGPNAPDFIRQWLADHQDARLVIIDVLARVRSQARPDEPRYDADYRALSQIKAVADAARVPFLVLHHTRKMGSADFLDEVSGTQGIAGAADALLLLRRMRGEAGGLLQVTGRDIEEADYALTFAADIGTWQMSDVPADEVLLGGTRAAVLRWLKKHEGDGPSAITAGTGIALATVKQTVRRMVAEAQLDTDEHGRYFAPGDGGDL